MLSKKIKEKLINLDINSRGFIQPIPKYAMPEQSLSPRVAADIVHQEMALDGNPILNLATFVTTEMEPEAKMLMMENINKNYVDQDEYPQTIEIQNRCVNILANLFNAPEHKIATGTATIGSSEAIHLAGLALKWKWRKHQQKVGLPYDKPNIVISHNVQVCWEKFARYFDVEPRYVPLTKDRYVIDVNEAMKLVDQNTIVVAAILGSTMTGEFDPIAELNEALTQVNQKNGWQVPLHIDAASGGFVAPFVYPDLKWDFRLSNVMSINTSGHKYGLVYPGLGWIIWRNKDELPEELIFHVNYLGQDEPTFNLNFSKNASNIIAQYYNFLRLGKEGYREIMTKLLKISGFIANAIKDMGDFSLVSKKDALPLVCFQLKDTSEFTVFDISEKLRERGWIVPAYTLPPNAEDIAVLRIVIREGFNLDLAEILMRDLKRAVEFCKNRSYSSTVSGKKSKRDHVKVC